MFVGHYGPSFAAKAWKKSIPLWVRFLPTDSIADREHHPNGMNPRRLRSPRRQWRTAARHVIQAIYDQCELAVAGA
jgi:hypothetical protein